MAMLVVAEPPEQYAAWVARQARPAAQSTDAVALHGREVFERASCASCHTVRGTAAKGTPGPDQTHPMSRETITAGLLANTHQNLAEWIRDPAALKPGATMSAVSLSDADGLAVVRWLTPAMSTTEPLRSAEALAQVKDGPGFEAEALARTWGDARGDRLVQRD